MTTANIPNDPVAIQRFFTSRDNNANASTYVGQEQRLWYDPISNAIYVSDGNTAGGILVGGSSGNGVPGGPTNSIQYNAGGGNFGGTANLTISGTGISVVGNVASAYFIGDGSQLTNLPLGNYTGNISGSNISITNTANLGNLTINDQTISGTIVDRDVSMLAVGNADVNIGGGFNIHSSGNLSATAEFQVAQDGQVTILVPTPDQYSGAVRIIGSSTGTDVPAQNYGVMLHITGQSSTPSRYYNDGVSNYAAYIGRRYNGTSEAPTGVLNNQIINRIGATPYLTDDTWPAISTTRIDFITTENQTTTAQGSKIQMWATPTGNATPGLVADFGLGGINLTGNLIPTVDNIYSLGNVTNRWIGAYFGNAGIYIQDTTLGTTGAMSLDNGIMLMDGNIDGLQIGSANSIQLTTDGLAVSNSTLDINIGTIGDTGNTHILNAGVKFTDNTVQTTAAIPLVQKGNALGVVPLNASTKIDPIYLPSGAITFKGVWNAANNNPTLADGVGVNGDEYIVGVAGTQNLGSGNITFAVGDFVLYTSANVWIDIPVGATGVQSFNGRDGIVTLQSGDVTNALSAGSIVNSKLANTGVTINTGAGLSGGGAVNLGGTLTLTATGVVNVLGGTGVNVVTSGGNATVSIGQPVGTANSVQFFAVTANTTVQATGNVTGGNLATAGRVVATGNIVTSANVVTPGTVISSSVSTTGNVIGANLVTGGLVTATGEVTGGNLIAIANTTTANLTVTGISNLNSNANVKITGGSTGQLLSTDGTGNLLWISSGNIAPTSGTWTPTLVPETGSYTLTINNTYYQKIGGVAFCTFDITIASQSTPNGNIIMGNLPFTSASTAATTGSLAVSFYTSMNSPTNVVAGTVPGSATTVTMYWQGSSDTKMDPLTHNRLKATTRLVGSVYYATV